jgi:gluconolactonase
VRRVLHAVNAALVLALLGACAGPKPDRGLSNVISPDAKVELVQDGFVFTEGPVPTSDGGLLFSDLRASRIYRLDLSGAISVFRDKTNETNGLAYTPRGELLAAETGGKRISISGRDERVRELTRGDGTNPLAAVNDLIADARGGVYFTDPNVRPIVPGRKVFVYYLPPDERFARVVDDSITRPNGLMLSLDGRTLYVADTVGHDVFAFDIRADGRLEAKRVFARLRNLKPGEDSGADGMAIDREGRVFVTSATGVQMFDRAGDYLGTIPVPRRPTNVAFSGPGKGTLYITAREGLYRVRMLTRGPERPGK